MIYQLGVRLSLARSTPLKLLFAVAAVALLPPVVWAADVAILKSSDVGAWRPAIDALQRSASTHRFTEHDVSGDRARGEAVLGALKGKAAVLVALGPLAAAAAHEVLPDVPMVFCMVQDPARSGINVGRPTVTGVSFSIPVRNQLATFHLVDPRSVRIGVIYSEATTAGLVQEAEKAAALLQIVLVTKMVAAEKDVPGALRALLKGKEAVDAVWLIPEPLLLGDESRRHILSETLSAGKPIFSFASSIVQEGALVSSGPDYASIGERAGELVNRLVSGERRIEMVVPRPEIVVNTKIAAKLKIPLSPAVLKAARTF